MVKNSINKLDNKNIDQHLIDLGIVLPTEEESRLLDENGFVALPNMIEESWRKELGLKIDALENAMPITDELKQFQVEEGAARLANVIDQGPLFDKIWCHPRILGCVWHVFQRSFKISSLNSREPKKGQGHQGLHADWAARDITQPYQVVNCLWLIDGYTLDNGPTRLVPGSHLLEGSPSKVMKDTLAPHPQEIHAQAPAGSVIVYNAHTWHSGTNNRTGARRRVLHSYYTASENKQQQNQNKWLSEETKKRLSPAQKWLLDI